MKELENLSIKYNFDYDFVQQFGEELKYDQNKLSSTNVVGTNPLQLLPTCQTVIVVAIPYQKSLETTNLASFSWGIDYHKRVTEVLEAICQLFNNSVYTIDSNVLNERYFASKTNIGYLGKNSMFISEKYGSYCYLGLVLIEELITSNRKSTISCGSCNKCLVACPTNAISNQIDCSKCISERLQNRHNLNFDKLGSNIYGCDICQDVCPHNKKQQTVDGYKLVDLESNLFINKKTYQEKFSDTTFYWIGYRTFIRNVHIAYINKFNDYSKIEFLRNSNSEYLKQVYQTIMEAKNEEK